MAMVEFKFSSTILTLYKAMVKQWSSPDCQTALCMAMFEFKFSSVILTLYKAMIVKRPSAWQWSVAARPNSDCSSFALFNRSAFPLDVRYQPFGHLFILDVRPRSQLFGLSYERSVFSVERSVLKSFGNSDVQRLVHPPRGCYTSFTLSIGLVHPPRGCYTSVTSSIGLVYPPRGSYTSFTIPQGWYTLHEVRTPHSLIHRVGTPSTRLLHLIHFIHRVGIPSTRFEHLIHYSIGLVHPPRGCYTSVTSSIGLVHPPRGCYTSCTSSIGLVHPPRGCYTSFTSSIGLVHPPRGLLHLTHFIHGVGTPSTRLLHLIHFIHRVGTPSTSSPLHCLCCVPFGYVSVAMIIHLDGSKRCRGDPLGARARGW
ncbi:hypothetical protein LR48_Vigan06g058300 [Vigna angularis]|uniref:Uncharacterized protein n=1 Tax=Phaseolus angularis TaxID=3914 RepID=A0A0L9URQ9_PHAAN|nr:hypothetical protein LR48_Vigan06g058300 [Vigna angularis]